MCSLSTNDVWCIECVLLCRVCSLSRGNRIYTYTHIHTRTHAYMYKHVYAYTSYKVTPLLQNDKKLAKAAPIFVQMLKSETRPETADAVLIIKKYKIYKIAHIRQNAQVRDAPRNCQCGSQHIISYKYMFATVFNTISRNNKNNIIKQMSSNNKRHHQLLIKKILIKTISSNNKTILCSPQHITSCKHIFPATV
jgi:hypothetical protein